MTTVIIDVWDSVTGEEHLARFHRPLTTALKLVSRELRAGYLVNLAQTETDVEDADGRDFDKRHLH